MSLIPWMVPFLRKGQSGPQGQEHGAIADILKLPPTKN